MTVDLATNHLPSDVFEQESLKGNIAMTIVLISSSMFFATLFLLYAIYRLSANDWPPANFENIQLGYPVVSTLWVISISFFFNRFASFYDLSQKHFHLPSFILTLLSMTGFIVSQWFFYLHLQNIEIHVADGLFPSILYSFVAIHLAHLFFCLFVCLLLVLLIKKTWTASRMQMVKNTEKFVHFLGIIWILMGLGLFVF